MNELQEVVVVIAQPYTDRNESERSEIDVEFWRKSSENKLDYRNYEDITASHFLRLCAALSEYKLMTVDTKDDCMVVAYQIN